MVLDVASKDAAEETSSKTVVDNEKVNKSTDDQIGSIGKCFYFIKI